MFSDSLLAVSAEGQGLLRATLKRGKGENHVFLKKIFMIDIFWEFVRPGPREGEAGEGGGGEEGLAHQGGRGGGGGGGRGRNSFRFVPVTYIFLSKKVK